MTKEQEISRGHQAKAILENPLFIEAMGMVRQSIIDEWTTSPIRDIEGQEKLRLMLEIHRLFERALVSVMQTGTMARFLVDKEVKDGRRARA